MTKQIFKLGTVVMIACLAVISMFFSCKKQSSNKQITAFSFAVPPAVGIINESAKTIAVEVPLGTDITALVPAISISPSATVNPASGVTQNFSNPVHYTVTAEDASTAVYTVTVTNNGGGDITKTVTGIAVKTLPAKTTYAIGEALNLAGGTITVTYNIAPSEEISMTAAGVVASGFSSTTAGTKTLTLTYKTKSTTFTVNVQAAPIGGTPKIPSYAQTAPASTEDMKARLKTAGMENATIIVGGDGITRVEGYVEVDGVRHTAVAEYYVTNQTALEKFELFALAPRAMYNLGMFTGTNLCLNDNQMSYTQPDGNDVWWTAVGAWLIYGGITY